MTGLGDKEMMWPELAARLTNRILPLNHRERVMQTHTPTHLVSTIDLLCEHAVGLWAETYVFKTPGPGEDVVNYTEVDGMRYATFEEAAAEHNDWVQRYGGGIGATTLIDQGSER